MDIVTNTMHADYCRVASRVEHKEYIVWRDRWGLDCGSVDIEHLLSDGDTIIARYRDGKEIES
jgi:hypothetical protein